MIRVIAGNVVVQASSAIAPAIALALLLRRVGFVEFGSVVACQTLVALFVGVSDLGCSIRGMERVARRHHTRGRAATLTSLQLFLSFRYTSAIIAGGILVAYHLILARTELRFAMPTVALFLSQALAPTWALLALEVVGASAVRVIGVRLLWLGATVVFVRDGVTYLWLAVLMNCCVTVIGMRTLNVALDAPLRFTHLMPGRRFGRAVWSNSTFSLSKISANVYQSSPLLILTHLATPLAVGVYGAVESVHKVFATASYPITDALFSRTARTRSAREFLKYGVPLLSLVCVGIVFAGLRPDLVLAAIGGGKAVGAAPQLRLILVATALATVSLFVGYPLAGGLGYARAVNLTALLSPILFGITLGGALLRSGDPVWSTITALIVSEASVLIIRLGVAQHALRHGMHRAGQRLPGG